MPKLPGETLVQDSVGLAKSASVTGFRKDEVIATRTMGVRHLPKGFDPLKVASLIGLQVHETWVEKCGGSPVLGDLPLDRVEVLATTVGLPTHRDATNQLWWAARWASFGFPVFNLTHSLAASLVLTDCSGVLGEEFKLPFPAFAITLPIPESPLAFDSSDAPGATVPVKHIYVHQFKQHWQGVNVDPEIIQIDNELMDAVDEKRTPAEAREIIRVYKERMKKFPECPSTYVRVVSEDGLGTYTLQRTPEPEERVERWLHDAGGFGTIDAADPNNNWTFDLTPNDLTTLAVACRLVMNFALYVASKPLGPPENAHRPANRTRATDSLTGLSVPANKVWVVGREIKLPKQMRDAAKAYASMGKDKTAWRLQSRFIVRGHWRHQAYGKGRSERRLKWINPFWKGPTDSATAIQRLYEAATKDERKEG